MNKKTILVLAVIVVVVLGLVLSGCGKKEAAPEVTSSPVAENTTTSSDNVKESAAPAENKETSAEKADKSAESEKPAATEKPMTDEFIEENVSVGTALGGGSVDIEDGELEAPPQVNIPVEDNTPSEPVVLTVDITDITYEMYNAMSAAEQEAVLELFGSTEDFMVWLNYVKAEYEADHPAIEVGPDGVVDLG